MKKYLALFLLFVMGELVSCTQNNLNIKLLEQAENLMQAYPDSAMLLLNTINQPEKLHGKERADYALLLAEALDKNYLDSLQSGPLIQIASDYYKSNNDYVKAGKASYYYGKVMASKDSLSEAMQAYLDALYFLKKADEYKLQGLAFEHIGYLNSLQGVYDLSIDNFRQSVHYYELADDSIGMAYGCRNIARGYLAKQNNDSARWYINKGLAILPDNKHQVKASFLQLLSLIAKVDKQYAQAIDYIISAIKLNENADNESRYYLSLGRIYMDAGERAMAEKCFVYCTNAGEILISSGAYNYLYQLKKEARNYEQALFYKEKSDSIISVIRNDDLRNLQLTLQKKYKTEMLMMENEQIRLQKENQAYLYSIIIVLIIGSGIYLIKLYKKKNLRNLEALKRNEKVIEEYAYRIQELERLEQQERESKKEVIGKLNRKLLELTIQNKKIRENASVNALFVLDELKHGKLVVENITDAERQHIFDYFDLVHADFISRIQAEFSLTKGELLLAALIKIGFTNKQLMVVFDCELKSVYKNRQRLKVHLKLNKEDSLEQMLTFY